MKIFKKTLFVFFWVYLLVALPLTQAQNAPGIDKSSQEIHSGQRIQDIYNQLNLTDDQKKQLEANKKQHRAIMKSAHQEMRTEKQALQEELMKPQLDMPKINKLHDQIKAAQSQIEDNKLSSILAVRAILSPEQFSKFVGLMRKHKEEHEHEE